MVNVSRRRRSNGRVGKTPLTASGEPPTPPKSPPITAPPDSSTSDVIPETNAGKTGESLLYEGAEGSGSPSEFSSSPALPQPPTKRLPGGEIVNEVLDLTDQVASIALFGPIGVGKSFVAHAVLHHQQTEARFGGNRHFMRCDNLASSLEGFLERLSDVISVNHSNMAQLRSHLESAPPLMLLLDGVDLLLDPLAHEAEEISAIIEELGSYPHVCLVTTSRMNPEIPGFHRVEVPIPPEGDARDAFYNLCNLGKSSAVDDLIARLDFHPLSINLLARSVRENGWDEPALLTAWDDDQTSVLKTSYYNGLKDAVDLSFRCPTIQDLGTTARDTLEAIAAPPHGMEERGSESALPSIAGIGAVVDVLCKFSLVYRRDGFVKMLSPFRFYFLESALVPAQRVEVIHWDASCHPARARMSLCNLLCSHGVTLFEAFPVFTDGPRLCPTVSHPTGPRCRTNKRAKWIRRFESVKRSKLDNSNSFRSTLLIVL